MASLLSELSGKFHGLLFQGPDILKFEYSKKANTNLNYFKKFKKDNRCLFQLDIAVRGNKFSLDYILIGLDSSTYSCTFQYC